MCNKKTIGFTRGLDPKAALGLGICHIWEKESNYGTISNNNGTVRLRIFNIDGCLDKTIIDFFEKIMAFGVKLDCCLSKLIQCSMNHIPVFIISYQNTSKHNEQENSPDYLGCYRHGVGNDQPTIFLYMDRIKKSAKSFTSKFKDEDQNIKFLTTKVLIHEFAHAVMDAGIKSGIPKVNSEFYRWVEEPLANAITLDIVKNYKGADDKSFLDFVEYFISIQPEEYKLGAKFKSSHWLSWWKFKQENHFKNEGDAISRYKKEIIDGEKRENLQERLSELFANVDLKK